MKVTRIAFSKNITKSKLDRLAEIAKRLGDLRTELWDRFGSVAGVGLDQRELRDQWLADKRQFDVPARLWKETLRDTVADIAMKRLGLLNLDTSCDGYQLVLPSSTVSELPDVLFMRNYE